MRKQGNSYRKQLRKRAQAILLVTALTVTSFSSPLRASAATGTSYNSDITAALNDVLNGMAAEDAYQNAVTNLSTSLDNLEGAATVEGLYVTEVGADFITLEWDAFSSDSLVGYNVYYADKDTSTQNFMKLTGESKKTEDASVITVDKDITTFTVTKSTHKNYYFKVAPVLSNGEGSKSDLVESPTANEFTTYLENLDRGLIKVETTEGVFLSWRLLGTEVTGYSTTGLVGTDFNVYKDGTKVATVTDSTNYLVTGGAKDSDYYVIPVVDGKEVTDSKSASATLMSTTQGAGYLDIPLQVPVTATIEEVYGITTSEIKLLGDKRTDAYSTTTITYSANDVSVGDVDGDGQYEYFVKWDPSLSKDVSQQGFTGIQYIDCYELDGTLRYRIDLGKNIRAGAHYTQFTVFDFNEDGKAEISLKTAPGTRVLTFNNNDQNDIATSTYINTPDGESNDVDYVFTSAEYREYLIEKFMDWGVWANDTDSMKEAKVKWDKNLINLFAPEDGLVTIVTESNGAYTSKKVTRAESKFSESDVLVNVPVRDSNGDVVYQASGVANAYMETVSFDDPKTGLTASMYHDGGYSLEEATALADYFLDGYQYRMKKHNMNYYEGYIITGSEYLSVFNGETGAEMDTIEYEFERSDDGMLWGDYAMNYIEPGNRGDRFLSTVAYLDGESPYMVICRGYYTRQTIATYSLSAEGKLSLNWTIDSGWTVMTNPFNDGPHGMNGNNISVGTNGLSFSTFTGQGDHYVVSADVDSDGKQEIVYGGSIVDDNGDLYSSGGDLLPSGTWAKFGHGDSIHVTDIDPDRPGLEIFSCYEGGSGAPYGTALRDAELNTAVKGNFSVYTGEDTGRCMIGDLLPGTRGLETWGVNTTDAKGNLVSVNTLGTNQNIRWSADMTTQVYTGNIVKANGSSSTTVLTATDTTSNNSTKGNASLIADVFGDWREELIVRSTDNTKLRIYSNTEVTNHKMYTLMHDEQYRANVAGQNTAYNQPSYLSFYFASDTDWQYVPIPNAKASQAPGKVEVQPTSVTLDLTSLTIKEGSTKTLAATLHPLVATSTITWSSSDESIATVSTEGVVTGVKKGTAVITAETSNGLKATCNVIVKTLYTNSGLDQFAIGETRKYAFGTTAVDGSEIVGANTNYSTTSGYGWNHSSNITLSEGNDFVSGNNYKNTTTNTYDYPTFVLDVPVGIYQVKIVQGSDTQDSVVGAYVEENMYSVRWSTENFTTSFTEPTTSSYIVTQSGEKKESTVQTAVADGQLTIQLATSLTDAGVSGTTFVNSIEVTRISQSIEESSNPTLRFIGDSTVASYPPQDGGVWTPIPERTGWGSDFAMARFMDDQVTLVNKAVAGSSVKSYIYDGYYNDFFLNSNPGDTVIIEGGINDSAAGRRYSDATDYEKYLRYFIDSCQAFGLDVVISSGTSSATTYTEVMQKLATEYSLPYIDLLGEYSTYKNAISTTAQGDLTVDGTHLARVGGVLAAQIVANKLATLEGLSISGHVLAKAVNKATPTAVVTGLSVKAQTKNSITLAWNMEESTLYDPDQLITRFNVYRKAKGAADSTYVSVGQARAYVSASLSAPKLQTTIPAPETGDYDYAVSVVGLIGEGTKSSAITVSAFSPTNRYLLTEMVEKYEEQMYDSTHYTVESYTVLKKALVEATKVLNDTTATADMITTALTALSTAESTLVLSASNTVKDDFQSEDVGSIWGTSGNKLLSVIMEEDGNRLANAYVEAAGTRNIQKVISGVSSELLSVEFEWYPGKPDTRNCTEIQFSDTSGVYFSLKTSNNGHIGYVVGAYPTDSTAYLTGDGFHAGNTQATDCELSNELWYNVRVVFDYKNHTADLSFIPRDDAEAQSKVITGITIPTTASQVTLMNFLCMRGKQDNGTTNDLSVLWNTYLDNFSINYLSSKTTVDKSAYETAKTAYDNAMAGISETALSIDELVTANLVIDIISSDIGFASQADYNYATSVLNAAISKVPAKVAATDITVDSELKVTAGISTSVEAQLVPVEANEEVTWVSADSSIASITYEGTTAVITGVTTGTTTVTVKTTSGIEKSITVTVIGTAYVFGSGKQVTSSTTFNDTKGYGFNNYTYPTAAKGWVDNVYYARELNKTSGTSYISASASDYLAINSQVWTENEGGRDEDVITYENTNAFDVNLPNGNYEVNVTFTNPTKSSMDVIVKAEDIVRYSYGDHATTELAGVTLESGQTKTVTFNIALTDGQLTLRFEQNSSATSLSAAATKTVYVKGVSVAELDEASAGSVPTIYVLGDSTVQTYTQASYRTGWGQVLYNVFSGVSSDSVVTETSTGYAHYKTSTVEIKNYARDGRSSKSFLEEGRLNDVLLNVKDGDYVFAQFTHNDSNTARPNRYLSESEFRTYLENYNKAVKERGGTLVLVTPIALNVVTDGVWDHRFESYRQVMLELAEEEGIVVLDLMGSTYALLNAMGQTAVNTLSMYMSDTVHLQKNGADMYAKLLSNLINAYDNDTQIDVLKAALNSVDNSVNLDQQSVSLAVGDTVTLSPTIIGLDGQTPTYYTSNSSIASVDSNGNIIGQGEGTAIITVSVPNGAASDTTDFSVYTDYCVAHVASGAAILASGSALTITGLENEEDSLSTFSIKGIFAEAIRLLEANQVSDTMTIDTNAIVEDMVAQPLMMFDFGNKRGLATGFTTITNNTYDANKGYGFIGDISTLNFANLASDAAAPAGASEYQTALTAACSDGIRKDSYEFAVDLPAGTYMVSMYMYMNNNLTHYTASTYSINGVSVGGIVSNVGATPDDIAKNVKVTLTEPGQILIQGSNPGKLAILNALVISTYVEEVKSYNETAWTDLDNKIATLNIKMGLMGENSTPLNFDTSFVNKMLAVRTSLKTVKGMPIADFTAGEALIAKAEDAIANAVLYTESSLASVTTSLDELNVIISNMSGMKALVVNAISVIDYWLAGIDTSTVGNAYSLYVDFDIESATTGHLTKGYQSVTASTLYSTDSGYGLGGTYNFNNSATGNSLFDDYVSDPTFYVDLPAGNYLIRGYCGDLSSSANESTFNITDANSGTVFVTNAKVSSDIGQVSSTDMTFTLDAATKVQISVAGRLNALLIDQAIPVTLADVDTTELISLVNQVKAANIKETDYTVSSYTALTSALAEAESIITTGATYAQQYTSVFTALKTAYAGLTERVVAREILLDFGTPTSAVSTAPKLSGDGGKTTMGTAVLQGLGTFVYGTNTLDNGQHFGFDRVMSANETASGGAHFRDYVYSAGGSAYTFTADMPVGSYYVYVYTGDKLSNNTTKLYFGNGEAVTTANTVVSNVDGKTIYTQTSNAGGQFLGTTSIYKVDVVASDTLSDMNGIRMGKLSVTLFDDTTTSATAITARLNGIEITPVDPTAPLPIEEGTTPSPTEAPVAPSPTETPDPTEAPNTTVTPVPTEAPNATVTPSPTVTPVPTVRPQPTKKPTSNDTAKPTATPMPTPVVSKDSDGAINAKVEFKVGSDKMVIINSKSLEKALSVNNLDNLSVVIKNADEKTQAIILPDIIKQLAKLGLDIKVELRNATNEVVAIWKYSADDLKDAKGNEALYLGVSTSVYSKENASKELKLIKAKVTKAVQVSMEADGVLPAEGDLTLYLKKYSDIFTKNDKVYIYRVDEKTGDLIEIPETNQTISNTSTLNVGLTEGGNYIITTNEVAPAYVKSLKEQIQVSVSSKEATVGSRQKMKVTLPSSLELAATTELKDANEVSIKYASSNKEIATVSKAGVVVAKKAGKVKITTTVVLGNGSTIKYTTSITVK